MKIHMAGMKKVAPKPAKPATKTTRRPQLDKMGPGQSTMRTGYSDTYSLIGDNGTRIPLIKRRSYKVTPARADELNANNAYFNNPVNQERDKRKARVTMTSGSSDNKVKYYGDRNRTYKRSSGK